MFTSNRKKTNCPPQFTEISTFSKKVNVIIAANSISLNKTQVTEKTAILFENIYQRNEYNLYLRR